MEPHRAERISEALREELEELIGYELSDPRLAPVYVTEVRISPDLRNATIRVGIDGDAAVRHETLRVLAGARHYLRRQLIRRLRIYRVPELHFEPDAEVEAGRVEQLLKRIRKGRPRETGTASSTESDEKSIISSENSRPDET